MAERPDVASIHAAHAGFVWATLQRFGVRDADLEDMLQEVFVVVHQRLHTFDGSSRVTTWLYGIAMRVASDYRRRAYVRREQAVEHVPDAPRDPGLEDDGPEASAQLRQARARLEQLLDELDLEKRAVFVMFEIDELSCDEIASTIGVPVGTVYSRLHAARRDFAKVLARSQRRDARGGAP